jgi:hypothetical protein
MPQPHEPENRVWHYFIDSDGHLWHEGAEFDDPETLNLFMKKMERLADGRCHVLCQGEECLITAEDVPYVVQDVEVHAKAVLLKFPGGYEESLDPETLFVGAHNVLYAKVRDGAFTARFNRKSYLDLAKHIQYDSYKDVFYLTVDNRRYPIHGVST